MTHCALVITGQAGTVSGDCENGFGKYRMDDGAEHEGQWQNGHPHGKGTMIYASGNMFKGDFRDGKQHGKGTCIFDNGDKYEGDWER